MPFDPNRLPPKDVRKARKRFAFFGAAPLVITAFGMMAVGCWNQRPKEVAAAPLENVTSSLPPDWAELPRAHPMAEKYRKEIQKHYFDTMRTVSTFDLSLTNNAKSGLTTFKFGVDKFFYPNGFDVKDFHKTNDVILELDIPTKEVMAGKDFDKLTIKSLRYNDSAYAKTNFDTNLKNDKKMDLIDQKVRIGVFAVSLMSRAENGEYVRFNPENKSWGPRPVEGFGL